jgi:hypothetical protein
LGVIPRTRPPLGGIINDGASGGIIMTGRPTGGQAGVPALTGAP